MPSNPIKRPFPVTVLIGLVLIFTGMQILRVWTALAHWSFLNSLPLSVPTAYFVISGLVWSVVGIGVSFGLMWRKAWTRRAVLIVSVAFATVHWFERLVLQEEGPQSANMPFDLLMTVLLLTFVFVTMALPQARATFGAKNG
jgi:hypothetical protein